ncbi:ribosome maturation factor RimM [Penaeicola halotolerans]|uniref:ribosome maturation factor RimM n=1 Tax=Penaeicola halotolerans TaxID=2793196 RepID=UPI001CF87635|nr:ribosome maturation factor RimM [Penaeicola halotolerans]
MNKEACFQLGYVAKIHGIHGEVSIVLDVDNPEYYQNLESVFVEFNSRLVPFFIEYMVLQERRALVKFEDFDSVDQAEQLEGCVLYLPVQMLPELGPDKYYYHELSGYAIQDAHLGGLGTVANIYEMPSQVLIGMEYFGKEVLIPINDAIVTKVDKSLKVIHTNLPEGLLDVYLED